MKLKIQNRSASTHFNLDVVDLVQASADYSRLRDASGEGASTWPEGKVLDDAGNLVARISYNGKVWSPKPWKVGDLPLYNPFA